MLLKILHGHGAEVKQLVLHVDVGVLGVPGLPCGRLLYVSDNTQNLVQNLKANTDKNLDSIKDIKMGEEIFVKHTFTFVMGNQKLHRKISIYVC